MSAGNLFFAVCALLCVAGAIMTIVSRNPIRGAVGLLTTILAIAGLFLMLSAQFLAAIQLIVYAGAIVVLFVFVIMLLGPDAKGGGVGPGKATGARAFGGVSMAVLSAVGLWLLLRSNAVPTRFLAARAEHGTIEAVGGLLFGKGIVPFEVSTALLIVAAIGAIAVARSHPTKKQPRGGEGGETRRLFVGPIHPRDAGRPLPKEGGR